MSTMFSMTRDINGQNGFGLAFATDLYSISLVASSADSLTIPANYTNWLIVFSYAPGSAVWVSNTGTAEVPVGTSFQSTNSELLPTARAVKGGSTLSFITEDDSVVVGVAMYALS